MVAVKIVFIEQPSSWDAVATSLRQLSRERSRTVRFAGTIDELETDPEAIDIVVSTVDGMAEFVLQIYDKGMLDIPIDTIGMHLACSTQANVLIEDDTCFPQAWLMRPNGILEQVVLDADKLKASRVEYRIGDIGEQTHAPEPPIG